MSCGKARLVNGALVGLLAPPSLGAGRPSDRRINHGRRKPWGLIEEDS